jgi:putative two-component system response regulator
MWNELKAAPQRIGPSSGQKTCSHGNCAETILVSLALTIEARDPQTAGHCKRLARYATRVGTALNLSRDELDTLRRGGVLHDIGKVAIPDAILLKPGPLTAREYERMKQHTTIGDSLCAPVGGFTRERQIIRNHHERIDGSGYPDGLKGGQISLLAQIIGLVDAFDALTTSRPYKHPRSAESAYEELFEDAQRGWRQRELVEQFISLGRSGLLAGADQKRSDQ